MTGVTIQMHSFPPVDVDTSPHFFFQYIDDMDLQNEKSHQRKMFHRSLMFYILTLFFSVIDVRQ